MAASAHDRRIKPLRYGRIPFFHYHLLSWPVLTCRKWGRSSGNNFGCAGDSPCLPGRKRGGQRCLAPGLYAHIPGARHSPAGDHHPADAYFWATHSGAELDLIFPYQGRRYGVEVKLNDAPGVTKSMRIAWTDLSLALLYVVYPGDDVYPLDEGITAWGSGRLMELPVALT